MAGAFDLVIIGAGTGGRAAAGRAARLGLRTALVEQETRLGGTGLLKERLCRRVLNGAAANRRLGRGAIEWDAAADAVEAAASLESRTVKLFMDRSGVTVHHGRARMDGPGRVVVATDRGPTVLDAGKIVVACGSRFAGLPGILPDGQKILHADQLADLENLPASLVIAGGGSLGVELAGALQTLGSRVTLVEMGDHLLSWGEFDGGAVVAGALRELGVRVLVGHKVRNVRIEAGGIRCAAGCRASGNTEELAADGILLAVGRRPDTRDLGLESCAAVLDKRGFVQTDGFMESAEPGHYAVGGVVSTPALPHVAAQEGLIAAGCAAGRNVLPLRYHQVCRGTAGYPEAASFGLTEAGAAAAGYAVRTGWSAARGQEREITPEGSAVYAKVIVDDATGGLLGVHLVGPGANAMTGAAAALDPGARLPIWSGAPRPRSELAAAVGEALQAAAARAPTGGSVCR